MIINFELYSQFDAENAIRYGYTFALMGLLTDVGISWTLNNWKLNRCSAVFSALWQLCLAALFVGVLARNIFGKSLHELVTEGLHTKLNHLSDDSRLKLQETLERITNEGSGGLICIIL